MKRNADVLEEPSSWDSWSPASDSSTASYRSLNEAAVGIVPWALAPSRSHLDDHINHRTRKRVRDNRPDLDAIHQSTLTKLFNAQKQHQNFLPDLHPTKTVSAQDYSTSQSTPELMEPAQRSLHSFFNIGQRRGPVKLPSLGPQQTGITFSLCEDCGNDLEHWASHQSNDSQMMEIDQRHQPHLDDNHECAICNRNVCDMCAVRGDRRVCLECAMPGGG